MDQTADQRETQLRDVAAQDPWVAQVMRESQGRQYQEEYDAFRVENPDAPTEEEFDYRLMYKQGKMPDSAGEGFGFLPTEGYKSFWDREFIRPMSRYSTKTKDNQFDSWEARVLAQSARGAVRTMESTSFQMMQESFGGQLAKFMVERKKMKEDPWYVPRTREEELERYLENEWRPFASSVTDPDVTVGAAVEMLAATAADFAFPFLVGSKAFKQSPAMQVAKGKSAMKRLMARFKDGVSPRMLTTEYVYAANPESLQTIVKDLGEHMEEEWGMSGPLVDFLKAADDTKETKALAGMVEGLIVFEGLRTLALTGAKVAKPVIRKATELIANSMRELEAVKKALPVSMVTPVKPKGKVKPAPSDGGVE